MSDIEDSYLIGIDELLETEVANETDLLIVEDFQNTKKIKFRNLKTSLISDDETPAKHRIYSSQKVDNMITEISKIVENSIGSADRKIEELYETRITKKELDDAIIEIDDKKADNLELSLVKSSLKNYRDKETKITSSDLSYGTEEDKIHLRNLGSDVIDAMTGKTQVAVPSVPTGGWVAEDLANGCVISKKLSTDYRFKGTFYKGSLDRFVDDGLYVLGNSIEKLPLYEGYEDESRLLEVIRYGDKGKYIIQRVYFHEYGATNLPYYERKGLFSQLPILEFTIHFEITDFNKVGSSLLDDMYNNRGILNSGNIFDIKENGNWYCQSTVKNLPTADNYLVSIRSFGTSKEYEARLVSSAGCTIYACYEYKLSNGAIQRTEWFNKSSISKSKFDGKSVHIFGDGISYGLGASNINKTSYPAILSSKYGYRIYNHSLLDATAGNYNDEAYTDVSLLTQIKTASGLSSAEYAIIFVGSEDFRTGAAPIGTDDSITDTTFKGSLNLAIKNLLEINNNIKILLVSPIFRGSTFPGDGIDSDSNMVNDKYLSDFANAVVSIGKKNHIPSVNLLESCMINKYTKNKYLCSNGVFLNDTGHSLIAEKIHDAMLQFY